MRICCGRPVFLRTAPKSWDEFVSFAKTVKEKTGKYGAYLQESDTWVLQAVLESGGASMLTRDGDTATATFNSEKGKAAMQSYADMVLKDQSAVHLTNMDDGLKAFNDGEVAMCICSIAKATNIINSANFDVRSTTFPTFDGEERAVPAGGCSGHHRPGGRRAEGRLGSSSSSCAAMTTPPSGWPAPVTFRHQGR